jgi:hypothetical protein
MTQGNEPGASGRHISAGVPFAPTGRDSVTVYDKK